MSQIQTCNLLTCNLQRSQGRKCDVKPITLDIPEETLLALKTSPELDFVH